MSAQSDANALNFVRRSLAERRQSRPTPESATSTTSSGEKAHHTPQSEHHLCGQPPLSPSPGLLPAATRTSLTHEEAVRHRQRQQQQEQQQQKEDEEINAYWAWLAAASSANITTTASSSTSPLQHQQQQQQQTQRKEPPRRISYYTGFLPDTLDRAELPGALRTTTRASIDIPGVAPLLSTSERDGESVWGGATSSSVTGYGSGGANRRRRTTLSANFAGSVSGTSAVSLAHTQSVTFDETLASAMVSTSNRIKGHQHEQQLRRRSSIHRSDSVDARTQAGCGGGGGGTDEASKDRERRRERADVGDEFDKEKNSSLRMQRKSHASTTSNTNSASAFSESVGERARALTWTNGGPLPCLSESSSAASRRRTATLRERTRSKSSAWCTPSTPPFQNNRSSSSSSSNNVERPFSALTDSPGDAHRMGSHHDNSNTNNDSDAQLSHHQLTEAFYGSYKGGKMARDAYLYFISQQQNEQQQQQQHKKKILKTAPVAARPRGCSTAQPSRTSVSGITATSPQRETQTHAHATLKKRSPRASLAEATVEVASASPTATNTALAFPPSAKCPPTEVVTTKAWTVEKGRRDAALDGSETNPKRKRVAAAVVAVAAVGGEPARPPFSSAQPPHTPPPPPQGVAHSRVAAARGQADSPATKRGSSSLQEGETKCVKTEVVVLAAAEGINAAVPDNAADDAKRRLAALWRRSEHIFKQSQQRPSSNTDE